MYVCIIIIIYSFYSYSFSNLMLMASFGLRKKSWTMNEDNISIHKWVIFKGIIYGLDNNKREHILVILVLTFINA